MAANHEAWRQWPPNVICCAESSETTGHDLSLIRP